jgi:outer membrane protein
MNRCGFTPKMLLLIFLLFPPFSAETGQVASASGQTENPAPAVDQKEEKSLALSRAVDLALQNNPRIRATRSGREMADAQLREAQGERWPLLQFNETYTRSNNPVFVFGSLLEQGRFGPQNFDIDSLNNPDALNNFRTAVNLKWPLFDQLQSSTRVAQARIGQEQAEYQKEMVDQRVRFEVIRAYYGVLVAQERKEVAAEAVRMAEAERKRIDDLFQSGLVVQSDLLSAQVQEAEFRQHQVQAEGDVVTAYALLNTVMGLPVETPQKVSGRLEKKYFPAARAEDLIGQALKHRPDYARVASAVRSKEEGVRGAKGNYLPRVDVFSSYGISGKDLSSGSSDYAIGAGLTFDLFDLSRGAKLDKARAAHSLASAEREELASQIRLDVVQAHQSYVTAGERLKVAADSVSQAREALRIVQDRYREGLTIITEVLRSETALVRSRLNLIAARYDYYLGYARILMTSGRLTDVQPFES